MIIRSGDLSSMKIKLLRGETVYIDLENWPRVQQHQWYARKCGSNVYAFATINHVPVALHRFILGLKKGDGKIVDHINHDTLNNYRYNLRLCSHGENLRNRKIPANHFEKTKNGKYCVRFNIGVFNTKREAQQAYKAAARLLFGE